MTPENETKVVNMLSDLAAKVGQSVETLWPAAVRYVAIDAAATMLGCLVGLAACVWAYVKLRNMYRASQKERYSFDDMPAAMAMGIAGVFCAMVVLWCMFVSAIPDALEPTGAVVRAALAGVKK